MVDGFDSQLSAEEGKRKDQRVIVASRRRRDTECYICSDWPGNTPTGNAN